MIPNWMQNSPTPFSSILVANRGEIAVRIIHAAKEAGLRGIAVYSDSDINSLHAEIADESIHLPGKTLSETYLNIEAIISAAKSSGAEAVHPGYGFLSERANFARKVSDAGLVWIGPSPESIEVMGDKISARKKMIDFGVPIIPGEELVITNSQNYMEPLAAAAARVGYPLLLKASAGGGGKGMRAVYEPKLLKNQYEAASREAAAAFGDGTVYVERLLSKSRHIEIQVLCDKHGNSIHLNERDCSLQRRHQKVIEETPCLILSDELRQSMGKSAIIAAKSVNYIGAGTVEFLLSTKGEFFFLEMNTRLQVEHPITELVTGIDIVQKQFEIAAGMELGIIQEEININGHSIEARIYAENPSNGFLPATGILSKWDTPSSPGVRIDSGFREGDKITVDFDPMLAKLIVHSSSREAAIRRLDTALSDFIALGVITNIGFLKDVINDNAFSNGMVTTDFLDNAPDELFSEGAIDPSHLIAIASSAQKLGLDKINYDQKNYVLSDDYNGHGSDPFRTLSRNFP
ncbi:MAG: acetyl-CoA carboxylase biotin carboxylase subunit [Candidatus Thalassarchaeaceae archaeon]|jgi:acetyl-CoA carboxylase biotin carboxylase subunit